MRIIKKGATSQSIYFIALDSASTTGGRKTGILYNAAGLTAYYTRNRGLATAITLATLASADAAWATGGFIEVSATNAPGLYRLDVPDAAFATGVDNAVITIKGAAGMVQADIEIQLTAVDSQDAVRGGMTALPNANAEAAGGLFTRGTGAGQINQDANGRIDANVSAISADAVAADNAESFFDGTGYAGTNNVIPTVSSVTAIATNGISEASIATDARARIQTEAEEALVAFNLDHLVGTATAIPAVPAGTFLDQIMDDGTASYDRTTDSLQAIRDASASLTDLGIIASTTIATLASQTSFTLTAGSADNSAYVNCRVIVTDATTAVQKATGKISAYTGATKTVTLAADPGIFVMAAGDGIVILPPSGVDSDVSAIKTKTDFLPSATAGAAGGVFIAGSNAATSVNVTGNITGNLSGSVGSVTGAVGSVTGLTASNLDATVSSRATPAQILTTALPESYAADGAEGTLTQILYFLQQTLTEFAIAGTTITVKKLDGTTTAATFTLDSSTTPTSRARAT